MTILNRLPSGSGSISELSLHTGLHRTTVKRLLETLRQEGFLGHDLTTNHYYLTYRVQQLSFGFRDTVSLVQEAWPEMHALSKSIVWPCSLLVPEGEEMVVRASTRFYSRLSFHPGMPGRHLPMLTTAAGRAYISYVSVEERETLLDMIRSRGDEQSVLASDSKTLRTLFQQTRKQGYALNLGEWRDEPKFGGVSMPLRLRGDVQATVNVIFLTRAVKEQGSLPKLVNELKAAIDRIQQRLDSVEKHRAAIR